MKRKRRLIRKTIGSLCDRMAGRTLEPAAPIPIKLPALRRDAYPAAVITQAILDSRAGKSQKAIFDQLRQSMGAHAPSRSAVARWCQGNIPKRAKP